MSLAVQTAFKEDEMFVKSLLIGSMHVKSERSGRVKQERRAQLNSSALPSLSEENKLYISEMIVKLSEKFELENVNMISDILINDISRFLRYHLVSPTIVVLSGLCVARFYLFVVSKRPNVLSQQVYLYAEENDLFPMIDGTKLNVTILFYSYIQMWNEFMRGQNNSIDLFHFGKSGVYFEKNKYDKFDEIQKIFRQVRQKSGVLIPESKWRTISKKNKETNPFLRIQTTSIFEFSIRSRETQSPPEIEEPRHL